MKSRKGIGEPPNRPSGRRHQCAVRAFCRRQNLGAGGIHRTAVGGFAALRMWRTPCGCFRRAFNLRRVEPPEWAAEPTRKGHLLCRCPFLVEGTVKIDISFTAKMPPAGRPTNCEPSAAGRSWKGGAREWADDVFFACGIKRRRSKADFAPTWCARRDLNPHARNEH